MDYEAQCKRLAKERELRIKRRSEGWIDHGMFLNPNAKVTKARPKKSTTALYQSLEGGELQRKVLEEVMFTVNQDGKHLARTKNGYLSALFSYHLLTGRLARSKRGRNVFYSLTAKGRDYAKERGIF